jgi:hypothetical protein
LTDEKKKVEKLENSVNNIQRGHSAKDIEFKLIELTKHNTLLEINLNKLSRKYTQLEDEEKLLRRNY